MLEYLRSSLYTAVSTVTVTTSQALAILLMTCIAIKWLTHYSKSKRVKLPPGPPGYPIIGNLLDFANSNLVNKSLEWKEKYGPIISFRTGPQQWIALTSFETVTDAFVNKGADLSNRPILSSVSYLTGGGKNISMTQYSDDLKYRRKNAMQGMRQYMNADHFPHTIHATVTEVVERMTAHNGAFDPRSDLGYQIFNIIHSLCFGYTFESTDPLYLKLYHVFHSTIADIFGFWEDLFPLLTYCPTKKFRQFKKDADFFVDYVKDQLNKRRAAFDENTLETLSDNILMVQKQAGENNTNKKLTDDDVLYFFVDVFLAGIETTSTTLEWVILILATYEEVQRKCQDEIQAVLGEGIAGVDKSLSFVYTEAVIMEVLRLYPPAYIAVPHRAARDTQITGYDVPANTNLIPNLWAVNRDPRYWESPDSFRPERFIEADGKTIKTRPKSWLPFGVGPRICIGRENLARMNLLYSVIGLLQKVHLKTAAEDGPPDLTPQDKWTICSCKPFRLVVTER